MENQIKAQVLKEIMKSMLQRDGQKIKPKPAPPMEVPPEQKMYEGGVVGDELHIGNDSDMSQEDAEILAQLNHDEPRDEESQDDDDEDEEAGKL